MIAITGISFELPGITDWDALIASLGSKETYVGTMPAGRLQDVQHRFGNVEMAQAGFMQRVDLFDNEYFQLSRREALKMSPEQRLFLLHAVRAFYDAGYSAAAMKGTNTGIFYTTGKSNYDTFWDEPLGEFDALSGIEGTRLAHLMDLRGPVLAINTSCSSSLVAVDSAVLSLEAGQCKQALVGGVKITGLTRQAAARSTVMSKQQQCRPFDDRADGLMNGEGAICILLKRLEDAEKDGDPVYAVIKGTAVNHGGARISSLTAPSARAQEEVIVKAWQKAGVQPSDIRYVEAHGTGTILGDPIEYAGLKAAFANGGACAISSFKGQIGHLDTLSGLAGLLRLVAALNAGVIPVQANFDQLNQHIDYDAQLVKVQTTVQKWEGRRIGGVSSFGLTGTNVHVVVSKEEDIVVPESNWHFLQISESNEERLQGLKSIITTALDRNVSLSGLSHKLNRIYTRGLVSQGFVFSTAESLMTQLAQHPSAPSKTAWYILDLELLKFKDIATVYKENKLLTQYDASLDVLFQYSIYQYLINTLGDQVKFITRKGEGVLDRLVHQQLTVAELIARPELAVASDVPFDEGAFGAYLESRKEDTVIVDFSSKNPQRFQHLQLNLKVISGQLDDAFNRYTLYLNMLKAGKDALQSNMPSLFTGIQLPYFQLQRFWPESKQLAVQQQVVTIQPAVDIKETIREMWRRVLETASIKDTDDFFDLGGDSLAALDMIRGVEKQFQGVKFSYEDMYDLATINAISQAVADQLQKKLQISETPPQIKAQKSEGKDRYLSLIEDIKQESSVRAVPDNILITGATGLVGGFLTAYLYEHTNATLYCLVRAKDNEEANERFWDTFSSNFDIPPNDRIRVIDGDLSRPDLGIHVSGIQAIYHVAGSPAFAAKVKPEEHINYTGTKHCVDWANFHQVPTFHLISTIGIVGKAMPGHVSGFYETDLDVGQDATSLIHASSKLLAEKYVRNQFTGHASVFRIPNVGGRYSDGFTPADISRNLMYLRIKALEDLGCYSEEITDRSTGISLIPVDMLVALIVEISFAKSQVLTTYHLNTVSAFTVKELVQAFLQNGIGLELLDHEAMTARLDAYSKDSGLQLFSIGKSTENNYTFHNEATLQLIEKLDVPGKKNYERQQYLNNIIKFYVSKNPYRHNGPLIVNPESIL